MQGLAGQKFLRDLALELDAVRAVLGHGLPSFESPVPRSMALSPACPPQGALGDRTAAARRDAKRGQVSSTLV
jgi:hypothetical protein